jgi:hypothetical protein
MARDCRIPPGNHHIPDRVRCDITELAILPDPSGLNRAR